MNNKKLERKTIAVCCATLREISVVEPVDYICKAANERGLYVQIFQSFEEINGEDEIINGEKNVFDLINYDLLCGMIIFAERIKDETVISELIAKAKENNIPIVSFDKKIEGCSNVTFDYADSFEKIVRHLVDDHHFKKFFVMAGMKNNSFSDARIEVVRKVLAEHNLTLNPEDIDYGDFWEYPTRDAMHRFFESGHEIPDAFIALNDAMATIIIDELQKHGYSIPKDVAVTGFDGLPLADAYVPKITTAKQQFDVAGEKAVKIIAEFMDGSRTQNVDESAGFKIQLRQSCGCQDVDLTGVSQSIRDIFSDYENCKRFGKYMDEMARGLIIKGDVENLIKETYGYSVFVDNHSKIFLCANIDYLKNDRAFYNKVSEKIPDLEERHDKDMALILEKNSLRNEDDVLVFNHREILPSLESIQRQYKNLIILTVHSGRDIFGYIVLEHQIGNRDSYKTRMFVNRISNLMLVIKQQQAIENSNRELTEIKKRLEQMYVLDPMTGIYNRRGFYQKYGEFLEEKKEGYITVLSVDLDGLKSINDTYGHQEGDFAIRTLGECLAEMVGERGIYARFGGDEFVALIYHTQSIPDVTSSVWNDMMERLRDKKEAQNKKYEIQCSLGAVQAKITPNIEIESLISKSDKVLYKMKREHHKLENME